MSRKKPEKQATDKARTGKSGMIRWEPDGDDIYRTLIETLPQKIFYKNKDLVYVSCNASFAADLKINAAEICGKTDYDLYPAERAERYRTEDLNVMATGKAVTTEELYVKDGKECYITTVITPVKDTGGKIIGVIGIFWDITSHKLADLGLERYRKDLEFQVQARTSQLAEINATLEEEVAERQSAQDALKESEERFRGLVENINDVIFTVDTNGNLTYVSPAIERISAYKANEMIGQSFTKFAYVEDLPELLNRYVDLLAGRMEPWEFRAVDGDGQIRFIRTSSRPVYKDGKIVGATGILSDVTERKKLELEMAQMASHDYLTGLPNRALFTDRLIVAMAQASRKKSRLAVLVMDLDYFKSINDKFGHLAGDRVLQTMADRLAGIIRQGDTVARVGGDEFVLLIPELKNVGEAVDVALRSLEVVREPLVLEGSTIQITTSIGIAVCSDCEDAEALVKKADSAMYQVKKAGRNGYAVFSETAGNNHVLAA